MQDENQSQEAAAAEPTYERGQRPEIQHLDDAGTVNVAEAGEGSHGGFAPNMEAYGHLPPAEVAPTGVKTINGVDVVPLGEVSTPDGLKPFADGKIVGVFDQDENKPIHERMGLPDVFITEQLRVNGVANPEHWMRGMNRAVYESRETVEQKIYVVNQHLRLHVAEQDDEQSARMRHRMTIADVNAEDWYRIIAADVLPYLVERDKVKKKKEAEAKTA